MHDLLLLCHLLTLFLYISKCGLSRFMDFVVLSLALSLIFHQLGYLPMTLPARLMAVAPFQESSIVTLNFILVLGVTSQCVNNKGLNAEDGGNMWSCCL